MIEPYEKSTGVSATAEGISEVAAGVLLDPRLAIVNPEQRWLAASDLHFGYELSRRAAGGLWPLWGMTSIMDRLAALIDDWKPETVILVGDVVDSSAAPAEAIRWLGELKECCPQVILVEGNHDRGRVRQAFDFVPYHQVENYVFHHGHLDAPTEFPLGSLIEITGHLHPSHHFNDGAGTSLRLPALTREIYAEDAGERWTLPAFSPWAGGHPAAPLHQSSRFHQWACGGHRVFEVV